MSDTNMPIVAKLAQLEALQKEHHQQNRKDVDLLWHQMRSTEESIQRMENKFARMLGYFGGVMAAGAFLFELVKLYLAK